MVASLLRHRRRLWLGTGPPRYCRLPDRRRHSDGRPRRASSKYRLPRSGEAMVGAARTTLVGPPDRASRHTASEGVVVGAGGIRRDCHASMALNWEAMAIVGISLGPTLGHWHLCDAHWMRTV